MIDNSKCDILSGVMIDNKCDIMPSWVIIDNSKCDIILSWVLIDNSKCDIIPSGS